MIHFGTIHSWSRTSFLDQHCSANVGLLIDKLKDASLTISLLLLLLDKFLFYYLIIIYIDISICRAQHSEADRHHIPAAGLLPHLQCHV